MTINLQWSGSDKQSIKLTAKPSALAPISTVGRNNPTRIAPQSPAEESSRGTFGSKILDDVLFDNAALAKVAAGHLGMHLGNEWRRSIFQQLDLLLSSADWEEDSAKLDIESFITFLRLIIYARLQSLPSIGIGPAGHLLAAWDRPDCKLRVKFQAKDLADAVIYLRSDFGPETISWRGNVTRLKSFLETNKVSF